LFSGPIGSGLESSPFGFGSNCSLVQSGLV
jgi:hypothetical protein